MTLTATVPSAKKAKAKRKAKAITLGRASFHLVGGRSRTVYVKPTGKALRLLKQRRHLKVTARIVDGNGEGSAVTVTRTLTLRYAPAASKKQKKKR